MNSGGAWFPSLLFCENEGKNKNKKSQQK